MFTAVACQFKSIRASTTLILLVQILNLCEIIFFLEMDIPRAGYLLNFPSMQSNEYNQLLLYISLLWVVNSSPLLSLVTSICFGASFYLLLHERLSHREEKNLPGDLIDESAFSSCVISVFTGIIASQLISRHSIYINSLLIYSNWKGTNNLKSFYQLLQASDQGIFIVKEIEDKPDKDCPKSSLQSKDSAKGEKEPA